MPVQAGFAVTDPDPLYFQQTKLTRFDPTLESAVPDTAEKPTKRPSPDQNPVVRIAPLLGKLMQSAAGFCAAECQVQPLAATPFPRCNSLSHILTSFARHSQHLILHRTRFGRSVLLAQCKGCSPPPSCIVSGSKQCKHAAATTLGNSGCCARTAKSAASWQQGLALHRWPYN